MKRIIALMMFMVMVLTACTEDTKELTAGTDAVNDETKVMKEYTTIYTEELSTLNYLVSPEILVNQLAYNMIDGLVEYDKYGVIQPNLATKWSESEDGLTWTFNIRKGVNWYNYEGKVYAEVTAHDFVDGMKYLLTKENASNTSNIAFNIIKNSKKYYDGEITDFSLVGIKAVDDYTLQYTLENPTPYFLSVISYMCFLPANGEFFKELEEKGEKFGTGNETILFNGAYIMTINEPENRRVLEFNKDYWNKDNIFISRITYNYNKEGLTLAPELFLRGEVTEANIPLEILDEWINDPEKSKYIYQKPNTTISYFYGLNFEPQYEEEYGPNNWKKAVNNINFRKSLFHGLDRIAAVLTIEPYNPQDRLVNTITPNNFVNYEGTDYTDYAPLKEFNEESFDKEKAIEYKNKALEELRGKVDFPVKVVMPYNTGTLDLTNRVQVVEQQMEGLLGQEYIDIILVPYPPTGYAKESRSSGKFSMMEMNWGPDYVDPSTFTDVFMSSTTIGTKYNRPYLAEEYLDTDDKSQYEKMVEKAQSEVHDLNKRYELFAEAEAFLIRNAIVIPFYSSGGGYAASYVDPFSGFNTQFGRSVLKLKGKVILDNTMNQEQYKEALDKYESERKEAQSKVKK